MDATNLSDYETAKKQIENKFTNSKGNSKERRLLDSLNQFTFGSSTLGTIVLDIEINLNGNIGRGKKCDLVLYNTQSGELMFVEGKVFSDSRVNVKFGLIPEVIEQVKTYTVSIVEQKQIIIEQYGNHVSIINRLFGTSFKAPTSLIQSAKLLVYETPSKLTDNNRYSISTINSYIGENNVAWLAQGERPSVDTIWESLCK